LADLRHHAAHVAPKNERELDPRNAFANPEIKMVQRTGFHLNQHVVFTKLRLGNIFVLQDLGTAELMNADGFHWVLLKEPRNVACPQRTVCRNGCDEYHSYPSEDSSTRMHRLSYAVLAFAILTTRVAHAQDKATKIDF